MLSLYNYYFCAVLVIQAELVLQFRLTGTLLAKADWLGFTPGEVAISQEEIKKKKSDKHTFSTSRGPESRHADVKAENCRWCNIWQENFIVNAEVQTKIYTEGDLTQD